MKAVFFRHNPNPLGSFPGIFARAGFTCEILDTWRDDLPADFDPLVPDVLIAMGGAPAAYQAHLYPFLQQEIAALKIRLTADRPTLGICLGAQLMAAALGQSGHRGARGPEIGWHDIALTPAGQGHAVRHLAAAKVAQSHYETFDLPDGVTLLASSEKYPNQIFASGKNGLAIQCHPEADAAGCRNWYQSYAGALESQKIDLAVWRRETEDYLPAMMRQTDAFLSEWLAQVHHA